jgi:hypothetical protein
MRELCAEIIKLKKMFLFFASLHNYTVSSLDMVFISPGPGIPHQVTIKFDF